MSFQSRTYHPYAFKLSQNPIVCFYIFIYVGIKKINSNSFLNVFFFNFHFFKYSESFLKDKSQSERVITASVVQNSLQSKKKSAKFSQSISNHTTHLHQSLNKENTLNLIIKYMLNLHISAYVRNEDWRFFLCEIFFFFF